MVYERFKTTPKMTMDRIEQVIILLGIGSTRTNSTDYRTCTASVCLAAHAGVHHGPPDAGHADTGGAGHTAGAHRGALRVGAQAVPQVPLLLGVHRRVPRPGAAARRRRHRLPPRGGRARRRPPTSRPAHAPRQRRARTLSFRASLNFRVALELRSLGLSSSLGLQHILMFVYSSIERTLVSSVMSRNSI